MESHCNHCAMDWQWQETFWEDIWESKGFISKEGSLVDNVLDGPVAQRLPSPLSNPCCGQPPVFYHGLYDSFIGSSAYRPLCRFGVVWSRGFCICIYNQLLAILAKRLIRLLWPTLKRLFELRLADHTQSVHRLQLGASHSTLSRQLRLSCLVSSSRLSLQRLYEQQTVESEPRSLCSLVSSSVASAMCRRRHLMEPLCFGLLFALLCTAGKSGSQQDRHSSAPNPGQE